MGLLQKLKSVLGLDETTSSGTGRSGDVDVTVEREPSTEDEDAVKGTDTASADSTVESEASTPTDSDPVVTDEPEVTDEDDEPETATSESDSAAEEASDDAASDEATTDELDDPDATDAAESQEGSDDPVTEIKGIGPAYADRLDGQDIETVGELAEADAAAIAAETDLGEGRVSDWIDRAKAY